MAENVCKEMGHKGLFLAFVDQNLLFWADFFPERKIILQKKRYRNWGIPPFPP